MRLCIIVLIATLSVGVQAKICKKYGPQSPRDVTKRAGSNPIKFGFAPRHQEMNLCNIHFHRNAEHRANGFKMRGGKSKYSGWRCNDTEKLSKAHKKPFKKNHCKNVKPGDTIEVHWVYSNCSVKPGKGLGACLAPSCANPQLRVETKVFLVVNDKKALNFKKFTAVERRRGYYQAKVLPNRDDAVQYLGSTTGPKYSEKKCSPLQVTWSVGQTCDRVNISTLSSWCKKNPYGENHAHGVRQIVKSKELLSQI